MTARSGAPVCIRRRQVTTLAPVWLLPFWVLPVWVLGGCGFRPVYGARGATAAPSARAGLAAIAVGIIPERSGQLLRQALQDRVERFGADAERRYALSATFALSEDAIGIEQDSTVTRLRVVGYTQYTLRSLDAVRRTVTSGTARAVDGYDSVNEQFFAADLENDQVIRRVAEAVADQVMEQLANYFDAHGLA